MIHQRIFFYGLWLSCVGAYSLHAQSIGLVSTLNMPLNARSAALGSRNVSLLSSSPAFFFQNPSLASARDNPLHISASFTQHYADIHAGEIAARNSYKLNHWMIGLRYLSFGRMARNNHVGQNLGTFSAGENLIQIGYATTLDLFRFGLSLKSLWTHIDSQSSLIVLTDLGAHYQGPGQILGAGLVVKNLPISGFNNQTNPTNDPLDLWIGTTLKTPHAPFRFSLSAFGWNEDLLYYDPYSPTLVRHTQKPRFFQRLFSHFNLATEIILLKRLTLIGSFNHHLRRNNTIIDKNGATGYAYGAAVHIWAFDLSIAQAHYQVKKGATTHLSLAVDWQQMTRNKTHKKEKQT